MKITPLITVRCSICGIEMERTRKLRWMACYSCKQLRRACGNLELMLKKRRRIHLTSSVIKRKDGEKV